MKTRLYKSITIPILLAGILISCSKDFLEEFPRLDQSDELTLSSYRGLESATAGTYTQLCATNWYGAGFVLTADLKGGNAKIGPISSGRYTDEYFWINSPSATSLLWTTAYQTIARANNVINVIDGGFSEAGVSEESILELKGENLFLRALAYFDMLRMYAQPYASGRDNPGVPLVLVTENQYPARNTVGEVYDQIVTDLQDAVPILDETNPKGNDGAWATSWSAKALLAKVYLYMENWQGAADMATDIIQNSPYSLFGEEDYTTWDQNGYWGNVGPADEVIFQVDGSEGNDAHGYWLAISYMVDPEGYGDIAASHDLLDLYEPGDVRAALFQEPAKYPGEYWTLKYPGRLGNTPRREYNVPVLRLSEMYLIRAEALLNGASITGVTALDDYNAIRTRRGLTGATTVSLQDIYDERRRELCFEGHELFDLARTQRSLERTDYSGAANEDVAFIPGGTPVQNYLWAMPIPQAEIDSNANIEQNPGYSSN
ncbi:MAG TPA: RagB/SusD family nutrient uptake outer membrane protein [Bacteroidetes bacterium]|nr:RagB/SusD family nutrient uptake outer membrane protein [Bacteroidota bacterium]